ncbi:hypothetical protein Sjap_011080 [Stephania japonica]|uniref:Uncharacterized protein n=1 Tax=Stephania japonica TaxID=461633 RepID=A0AAP0JCU5_9MAGN
MSSRSNALFRDAKAKLVKIRSQQSNHLESLNFPKEEFHAKICILFNGAVREQMRLHLNCFFVRQISSIGSFGNFGREKVGRDWSSVAERRQLRRFRSDDDDSFADAGAMTTVEEMIDDDDGFALREGVVMEKRRGECECGSAGICRAVPGRARRKSATTSELRMNIKSQEEDLESDLNLQSLNSGRIGVAFSGGQFNTHVAYIQGIMMRQNHVLELPDELLNLKESMHAELPKAIDAPFVVDISKGKGIT